MKLFLMALKNLTKQKRRTILLGLALTVSFCLILVLAGITNGIVTNAVRNIAYQEGGEITIGGNTGWGRGGFGWGRHLITNPAEITDRLVRYSHLIQKTLLATTNNCELISSNDTAWSRLTGFDMNADRSFLTNYIPLSAGTLDVAGQRNLGIVISDKTAKTLDVKIGDTITARFREQSAWLTLRDFTVVGICRNASYSAEHLAYVDIKTINRILEMPAKACTDIYLFVYNTKRIYDITDEIWRGLEKELNFYPNIEHRPGSNTNYSIRCIEETNSWNIIDSIVSALSAVTTVLFAVIVAIIAAGIFNTFRIIAIERRKEYGTLRALGLTKPGLYLVTACESSALALGSVIAGLIVSLPALLALSAVDFGTGTPISDFMQGGRLTFSYDVPQIAGFAFLFIIVAVVSAGLPLRAVSGPKAITLLNTEN